MSLKKSGLDDTDGGYIALDSAFLSSFACEIRYCFDLDSFPLDYLKRND